MPEIPSSGGATDIETGEITSASGATGWIDTEKLGAFRVVLMATARSGTSPTLDWTIWQSHTGEDATSDQANIGGSFTQLTSSTTFPNIQVKTFGPGNTILAYARYIKVVKTLGGTSPQWTTYVQIGKA